MRSSDDCEKFRKQLLLLIKLTPGIDVAKLRREFEDSPNRTSIRKQIDKLVEQNLVRVAGGHTIDNPPKFYPVKVA